MFLIEQIIENYPGKSGKNKNKHYVSCFSTNKINSKNQDQFINNAIQVFYLKDGEISVNDLWVHDEKDKTKANLISRFFDTTFNDIYFPRPFGIIYADERPVYEENMQHQIEEITAKNLRQ